MGCITVAQIRGTCLLKDITRTLGSVKGVKVLLSDLLLSSPKHIWYLYFASLQIFFFCDLSLTVVMCHPKLFNETCEVGLPLLSVGILTVGGILRHRIHIRGAADKSLARPGRKQATATELGIYSTYSPRSSIRF